jgi:hypothetical protein
MPKKKKKRKKRPRRKRPRLWKLKFGIIIDKNS